MTPELIIFDCDGVLIDSEVISARVLIEVAAEEEVYFDDTFVREHFLGRSFPAVTQVIRERFGVPLSPKFEDQYRDRLLERFESELRPTPGIVELLSQLQRPACVATSSSPPRARRSLSIAGLDRFFAHVFTASEVPRGKPAPDLFLYAAQKMGRHPSKCLVVEDSRPGLLAAREAGMDVAFYAGASHLADAGLRDRIALFDSGSTIRPFLTWADLLTVYSGLLTPLPESERAP